MNQPVKHVRDKIARTQTALRGQIKERAWVCLNCNYVLGVFESDYKSVRIKSQRVNLTVSGGSIRRDCYKCRTPNELATRQIDETKEGWIKKHKNQLAQRPVGDALVP